MVTTRPQPTASPPSGSAPSSTLALKEWGAAVHALLQGRQTILLRKGGIHEKAFTSPADGGGFVLFPTVAHSHGERTRPEHRDLLALGEADSTEDHVVVRAGVSVVGTVDVTQPDRLPELADLHIWTDESIRTDRVEFRPVKPLQVLVVAATPLAEPVVLPRRESYGGCLSWIDVAMVWDGQGTPVMPAARLAADLDRVRRTVGATSTS